MSLLNEAMEDCVMMDATTSPDGYGGTKKIWSDGAPFSAAIVFDTSLQARVAEKSGVTSLYTIITSKAVVLEYHDVFRRLSDGKIFRVTSDADDNKTPNSAGLNMRSCTAEEWIPSG